ncbi:hypothetical protein [Polaribacter sp. L3A8]|uniref:hypothetical protein n=1 Tax=Polaribacter sp. L3A8 TaxID=2686361 RepID=UPI00131E8BFC|nr:hypothetical protein [Polaribacter sp. L3A8]
MAFVILLSSITNLYANTTNISHLLHAKTTTQTYHASYNQHYKNTFFKPTSGSKKDLVVIEEISTEDFEESENHLINYSQKSLFDNNTDAILYKILIESKAVKTKEDIVSMCFNIRITSLNLHKKFEVFIL